MNPHFDARSDGGRDLPGSVYARVDSIEADDDGRVRVALDAVSTRSADGLLSQHTRTQWRAVWASIIGTAAPPGDLLAPFDGLELLRLEVTAPPGLIPELFVAAHGDAPWLQLTLASGAAGGVPAIAYTSLFAPGQVASITGIAPPFGMTAMLLHAAFSMADWPLTPANQIAPEFAPVRADLWHAFDVGQGSANGFVSDDGPVYLFHDIGCGAYANAKTCPGGLVLCHTRPAPIVLSHWDTDHWAGACRFAPLGNPTAFLKRTWFVPFDATIGPTHITFATSILNAGGSIVVLPPGAWQSPWLPLADNRSLRLLRGNGSTRNCSGVALEVRDGEQRRWLLTGDVEYQYLTPHLARDYVGMSVPHHGAVVKDPSAIPLPSAPYARLIYSFGHDNSYRHPRQSCLTAHQLQGWDHDQWVMHPDASVVAQGEVLATACNLAGTAHLGSIAVGWVAQPPPSPGPPCGATCSAYPSQS